MPTHCLVKECKNYSTSNKDVTFHRFPSRTKNKSTFEAWKKLSKAVKPKDFVWESSCMCSEHFTEDDYDRDLRNELLGLPVKKRLKKDAVPSIFPARKGKSLEVVEARKERVEKRKWVIERKKIVNDLLAKAEEEAREQEVKEEIVPDVEQWTTDEGMIKIDPEQEAYLGLSKEHLRRKIDSLWQVLTWKNKRIQHLTTEYHKLRKTNAKQLKKIKTLESKSSRTKASEENVPITEEESEIKEEWVPDEEMLEEETIIFMEKDLTEFCNYNRRHLQALNSTRVGDGDPLKDPLEMSFQMEEVPKPKPWRVPRGKDTQKRRPYPKRPKILKPVKPKKTWNCEKCPEIFLTLKLKMIHKREKHPWQIVEKTCPFCQKIFRGSATRHYTEHVNGHREERSFLCSVCGKAFKKKSVLAEHLKNVHPKEASHICMFCGKSFKTAKYLRNHEKLHQKDSSKFTCPICHKVFLHRLKEHIETAHKDVVKFSCDLCDMKFTQKQSLHRHVKRVHKKEEREADPISSSQQKAPEALNESALGSGPEMEFSEGTDVLLPITGAGSMKHGSKSTETKTDKK